MAETIGDILKRTRHQLEERGVLGGVGDKSLLRKGYTIKRSALVAYKEKNRTEYQVPKGTVIIEDI